MTPERHNPIPESKIKKVEEMSNLIKNKKTILLASIKNLPAAQLQEISKKLRGKSIIKIPKKSLFFRAIDKSNVEKTQELKKYFKNDVAILFSDVDSFELAGELFRNKSPAKAKPGQEAPEDIEVQAGPTDLMPGPAISELGAVGIPVQIEKGKITIREPKVIVKAGEKISQAAADIMSKLDIKPFSVGLIPLSSLDNETKTIYLEIKINPEETISELKTSFGKSLAFAVEISYASSDTVKFLLSKAGSYEKALASLIKEDPETKEPAKEEEKKEAPAEPEKPEESQTQTPKETKSEEPSESPLASEDSKEEASGEENK